MTDEEIKIANKTARSAGAVGKNAVLPRLIREKFHPDITYRILDFGAGPKAIHTQDFIKDGYHCTAYEMGDNFDPKIHSDETTIGSSTFDVVMASNVINVLSSISAVQETITKIHKFCKHDGGLALINFPKSPRKLEYLTMERLFDMLFEKFQYVSIKRDYGTKVFYCYRY